MPKAKSKATLKKEYFNARARPGTKTKNGKPLSDFVRGVYKGRANAIHISQVNFAKRKNHEEEYEYQGHAPLDNKWLNN